MPPLAFPFWREAWAVTFQCPTKDIYLLFVSEGHSQSEQKKLEREKSDVRRRLIVVHFSQDLWSGLAGADACYIRS
jgi:hypothetical protein